jgi:DNA polymerase-3 subunit alpha
MDKIFWGYQTHFSIGESIIDPEEGVAKIKDMGWTHIALADTMSLSALISVAKACKKHGLGMITGVTLRVKNPHSDKGYLYPKVYVRSEAALKRLYKLLSEADKDRDWRFISWAQFTDVLDTDMTVTTGTAYGLVSHALTEAQSVALLNDVGSRLNANGLVYDIAAVPIPVYARQVVESIFEASDTERAVALNPVALYLDPGDHDARDVMQGMLARRKANMGTMRWYPDRGRFIKTYADALAQAEEAIELATKLTGDDAMGAFHSGDPAQASWHGYEWKKADPAMPQMAPDEFEELKAQCKARFATRIMRPVFGYQPDVSLLPVYKERLRYELDILGRMGFSGYFLLVADLVDWSKRNGIIVGPGRGSVGGSLVAFIMGITEVDPIRFNLLFERFINPGRKDLPDADLDFMSERRHEVVEYLKSKYGHDNVGGISNYNTLQGAGSLRDVGKFMGLTEKEYDCSKMVPKQHGIPVALRDAASMVPDIQNFALKHPVTFDIATRVEGCLRNMSQHAAGVVVCHEPLVNRAVVETRAKDQCINWDKRVSEEQGLVKIDILGLSNLDVIEKAFRKIEHDTGKRIDILEVPLDDKRVLDAFGRGETVGVFQFESHGMRSLLKNLQKGGDLTFEELSAAMALFRPGPLDSGMLDDYVSIRQGASTPYYDHPNMQPALEVTGGVIIYQEQVMQVARDLAGFTLQEADDLRKAMGKKDKAAMAEQRDKWVSGCDSHSGLPAAAAGALFDKIEAFAGYGFNRSHSIEYAIISFVSMWLKVYYPLQFYAASLEVLGEDKLLGLVEDAAKRGIQVLPPDINTSDGSFKRDGSGKNLTSPFNRLKGLSDLTQGAILAARAAGPFKSKEDFLARVEKRRCNVRHVDVLERVGAFASLDPKSPPASSPTRTRDQLELMPGLVSAKVHVNRVVDWDEFAKKQIVELVVAPALKIAKAPIGPRASRKIKAMVITDAVTKQEEKAGRMMEGSNADYVKKAIEDAGGSWKSGFYYTALVKVPKSEKKLTAEEVRNWLPLLRKEIAILQPPVIIAAGSEIARILLPDLKGPIKDLAGKVVYSKELDANVVVAINPGMIWMDPSTADILQHAFEQALQLLD